MRARCVAMRRDDGQFIGVVSCIGGGRSSSQQLMDSSKWWQMAMAMLCSRAKRDPIRSAPRAPAAAQTTRCCCWTARVTLRPTMGRAAETLAPANARLCWATAVRAVDCASACIVLLSSQHEVSVYVLCVVHASLLFQGCRVLRFLRWAGQAFAVQCWSTHCLTLACWTFEGRHLWCLAFALTTPPISSQRMLFDAYILQNHSCTTRQGHSTARSNACQVAQRAPDHSHTAQRTQTTSNTAQQQSRAWTQKQRCRVPVPVVSTLGAWEHGLCRCVCVWRARCIPSAASERARCWSVCACTHDSLRSAWRPRRHNNPA